MKIVRDQTFWLGAMTAFATVFFALFVGMATDRVAIGDNVKGGSGGAGNGYPSEGPAGAPGEAAEPREITIEEVTKDDWVRGDRDAKVSVIEFSDIDCPFCSRFHTSMKNIVEQYDGEVNWVYRDFPLDQLHPEATAKAVAAECVGKLAGNDVYWSYLDGLFESSAPDEVTAEAVKLGIVEADFTTCQADPEVLAEVQDDMQQGAAAGASGTPYSVIIAGDLKIPVNGAVPEAQIISQIEQALNQ